MAIEDARDGLRNVHNVSSATDTPEEQGLELKTNVTSAAFAAPTSSDADVETGATASLPKEDEIYSVFSKRQRILILIMTVLGAIISPISGQIYYPALGTLAEHYHVSPAQINLTITTYLIFQGLAPMFVATFADDFGHRPAFLVCNTIYIISNVALATQNSYAALLVLRMLQSCGSSGTISLRNGIIAAIFTPAERGTYMGIIAGVTLCAPAFGPLIGGALTQTLGWRSIFWGLTIFTTAQTLIYALFVPETNRRVVGNGSIKPEQWWNQTAWQLIRESSSQQTVSPIATKTKVKLRWPNPIKVLAMLKEPDIALLIVTGSLCNAATYDIMASLPYMMTHTYGLSIIQLSLCYMPLGIGAALGAILWGRLLNYTWKRTALKYNFPYDRKRLSPDLLRTFPLEEARLHDALPSILLSAAFLMGYGWSIYAHAPLAVPLVLIFLGGLMIPGAVMGRQTLLVDSYPLAPSSVTAAQNIVRCLMGAGATAVVQPMLTAIGDGWTFTVLGLLVMLTLPPVWVQKKWGPGWRGRRTVRDEQQERLSGQIVGVVVASKQ